MAGVYKGLTIKLSADSTGLNQALSSIDAKGRTLTKNLKQVEKALKVDPKNTELLRQKFEGLGEQVKNTEERLKTLKQAEKEIGKGGMSTEEWDKLQREISGTEANLKTYTKQFKEANAQYAAATSGLGQVGSKIAEIGDAITPAGEKLQSIGGKMTAAFTTTAVAAGTASVKIAMDFETSLAKVSTLMDENVMSMEDMGEGARELATQYGVSASDINEALYQAMSASVDTAHALEFVGEATKLSKAGFTDQATAVDTLTTAINAYGMSADDAAHISDVLVNTQNLGKTTVNELGASMGNVIPTAAAYGVNLENLASAYVIMTKQGINTANATTALNGMMTELADNSSTVAGVLQEQTGKTFGQLMQDGYSLGDVLSILNDSVDGNSEAFANLWDNMRANKGALAIANGGVDEFNNTLSSMTNATGVVDAALEKLGGTTQAQVNKMKAQVEDAAITVGQALLPIVQDIVGHVTDAVKVFNDMSESEQRAVIEAAAFVAGLGPAITLLGTLMVNVKNVGNGIMDFATLLAKLDVATGGASRTVEKLDASTGKMVQTTTKASVAMGALKAGAATAAVAGVAILALAIKDYVEKQRQFSEATEGLVNATDALNSDLSSTAGAIGAANAAFGSGKQAVRDYGKEVDKLSEKQANLANEMKSSFEDVASKNGALQIYADKINELAWNCDGSAEKLAELQVALDGYNSIAGTSYSVTDTTTGAINASTDALKANTDAWKANAEAAALQSALTGVYEERIGLEQEVADTAAAVAGAEQDINDTVARGEPVTQAQVANLEAANVAHEKAQGLLEANYEAEGKLVDRQMEASEAYKTATATLDDYVNAFGEGVDGAAELESVMSALGKESTQEVVDAFKAAGISAQDFAAVGSEAFNFLMQQAGGDINVVKGYLDALNAAGIDPKELHVNDNGEIEDAKGRVVDLDKQTIDDKSFSVYANTSPAVDAISKVQSYLAEIRDKHITVSVNQVISGAARAVMGATGGMAKLHASGGFITSGPTALGYDANGTLHIAGEAGREWIKKHADGTTSILPIENKRYLKPYAQEIAGMIGGTGTVNNYNITLDYKAGDDANKMVRELGYALRTSAMMEG